MVKRVEATSVTYFINNGENVNDEVHFSQVFLVLLTNIINKEIKHYVKLYPHHTQNRAVERGGP
jgi:DNA phosphorothioation-dependent restriction protein DptG